MGSNWKENCCYQHKLFIVKHILGCMQEAEEAIKSLAGYQKRGMPEYAWGTEEMALKIDRIIPEEDIFYLIILVSPAKRRGQKHPFGEIYQFFKIEKDNVICEIVPSLKTPLVIRYSGKAEENLDNIISALSSIRGEKI